jgi:ADP-ribose pyrophosphatase
MKNIHVVAAIIVEGDKILATQRGYGDFKGMWEFPGGKIEKNETAKDALVREIQEELNVTVEVGKRIKTVEYDYPTFHLSMKCFMCKIQDGEIELREHQSAKWLTADALDSVEWLEADIELIAELKSESIAQISDAAFGNY